MAYGMDCCRLIGLHGCFDGVEGVLEGEAEKSSACPKNSGFEEKGVVFDVELIGGGEHRDRW